MKFREIINKRHSIREYENRKIPKKILKRLVITATKAPSAKNEQPWRFFIVSSKKRRDYLAEMLWEEFSKLRDIEKLTAKLDKIAIKFYKNIGNAQNLIFVFRETRKNPPAYQYFNDIAGVSGAIENLMLGAVEQGLGTCWIGTFKSKENEIKKLLNTPRNYELLAAIAIGYPKKGSKPLIREKRKLSEVLKFI